MDFLAERAQSLYDDDVHHYRSPNPAEVDLIQRILSDSWPSEVTALIGEKFLKKPRPFHPCEVRQWGSPAWQLPCWTLRQVSRDGITSRLATCSDSSIPRPEDLSRQGDTASELNGGVLLEVFNPPPPLLAFLLLAFDDVMPVASLYRWIVGQYDSLKAKIYAHSSLHMYLNSQILDIGIDHDDKRAKGRFSVTLDYITVVEVEKFLMPWQPKDVTAPRQNRLTRGLLCLELVAAAADEPTAQSSRWWLLRLSVFPDMRSKSSAQTQYSCGAAEAFLNILSAELRLAFERMSRASKTTRFLLRHAVSPP